MIKSREIKTGQPQMALVRRSQPDRDQGLIARRSGAQSKFPDGRSRADKPLRGSIDFTDANTGQRGEGLAKVDAKSANTIVARPTSLTVLPSGGVVRATPRQRQWRSRLGR
jgi:hypothetical protein